MDNNVKIVLGNGNVLDAVGISYIHIDASNKDYIFYSLNELANGNMDKIYIAEASQNGTSPGPISDDEWANIKQIMLNISHSEAVSGISYKPLVGMTFNIGEAKKLAIKGDKKQAFIDAQNKAIAPDSEIDEPAFVSDQAANGSPFFATDVNANGQTETKTVEEVQVQSAFAMQPPVQQDIKEESLEDPEPTNNVVPTAPVTETIDTSVVAPVAPVLEQPVITETPALASLEETPAVSNENPIVEEPAIPVPAEEPINTSNISVEELKQAVADAQAAIDKINVYLNNININNKEPQVKKVVVDTVQTQTISTGTAPVSTENMVVADQPEIKTDSLGDESELANPGNIITPTEMVIPTDTISTPVETISTSVDSANIIDTSVGVQDVAIQPVDSSVEVQPLEVESQPVNEEPAFSINDDLEQTQVLDLSEAVVPQATPNSAEDINNSSVVVNVPEAPVVDNSAPVIPITPLESTGIPTAEAIPTVAPQAAPEISDIQPIDNGVVPAQPEVQVVPEINVAPVQQMPTIDLSAINTDVTLPSDMVSNPNLGTNPGVVLGPATLEADDNQAA